MDLVRIIYCSQFNEEVDYSELAKIIDKATKHNSSKGITGLLIFGDDRFLQVLEGGREQVNELYGKIVRDKRNKKNVVLSYEEILEREFSDWSMRLLMLTQKNKELLLKYSRAEKFEPESLNSKTAMALLRDAKKIF